MQNDRAVRKPELLAPAGSPEVLRVAVHYGADAVYIGGEAFGLRAKAKNFSREEMAEDAVKLLFDLIKKKDPERTRIFHAKLLEGQSVREMHP